MFLILMFLPAALLLAGCTTAQVEATRQTSAQIEAHEPVAIVIPHEATELASNAVTCISKALKGKFPNLRIVLPGEFHKAAFPDVAPELAPRALVYLPLLLNDPAFRARIAPLGLRYLISVQGKTEQEGTVFGEGAGGASVLGWSADRKSNVTASVVDLKSGVAAGEIRAAASGKPWFVCVGVLFFCAPFGAPAFTEAEACDQIGTAVAKYFAGEGGVNEPSTPSAEEAKK